MLPLGPYVTSCSRNTTVRPSGVITTARQPGPISRPARPGHLKMILLLASRFVPGALTSRSRTEPGTNDAPEPAAGGALGPTNARYRPSAVQDSAPPW